MRSNRTPIGKTNLPGTGSSPVFRAGSAPTVCDLRECAVGVVDHASGLLGAARGCRCDQSFRSSEPTRARAFDRIFHFAITTGNRTRELAINEPLETPELAHLITLTQRAVYGRQVPLPDMLDDVRFAALAAAWVANPTNDPSR